MRCIGVLQRRARFLGEIGVIVGFGRGWGLKGMGRGMERMGRREIGVVVGFSGGGMGMGGGRGASGCLWRRR